MGAGANLQRHKNLIDQIVENVRRGRHLRFQEALQALLGPECKGLSATSVTRLLATWQDEQAAWSKRDLSGKQYVYVWADGIHFNIRLEEDRQCILVLMGATADGTKELIAVQDGHRESEQSWSGMLLDLKSRGLVIDPKVAIADGALGFWAAVRKICLATCFCQMSDPQCVLHRWQKQHAQQMLPHRLNQLGRR